MLSTPTAEIDINKALVRELVRSQIHELDHLELSYLESGWDNVMYRLGKDYIVRLPRRKLGADLIRNEQLYLDYLPQNLPINIPRTIFNGSPQGKYPWHWSILPYHDGEAADLTTVNSSEVEPLVEFLKCIHKSAGTEAPLNEYRGDLSKRAGDVEKRLLSVKNHLSDKYAIIKNLWQTALAAKSHTDDKWIHGDLHPRNVLVKNGKLSAIIDWGDITSGDIATDLASIWLLFDDAKVRERAILTYGFDKDLLERTLGWVIYFGVVFYESGLSDNSRHLKIGEKAFSRLLEDYG